MRTYSRSAQEKMNATGGEAPVLLLEITHPDLSEPIRVVNDNDDITSNGNTFVALAFSATMPDDQDGQLPRAQLAVDNVGRDLVGWLEDSGGGEGAQVKMMQVMRGAPDVIEWEVTLDLTNVQITSQQVTGQLGFEDLLNRPAIPFTYRPDTHPGLF